MFAPSEPVHGNGRLKAHAGGQVQPARQLFHFRGCGFLAFGDGGVNGLQEQVLEKFGVGRVNDGGINNQTVRFPSQVAVTFSLPPAPSRVTVWEASFSWAAASPACICWTCFIIFIIFMAVVFGDVG